MTAASASRPLNRPMISVSIMAATVMQVLDTTIANVALPHMQGSLSATQDQISWVLTSYIVAAAIMTPLTGWLAGRFGRKKLFATAVIGFTATSMLCGAAQSLEQMILFRLLQGVFGAALVPLSQSTLLDTTPPAEHGKAMALWGMGVMVGPILGPTLGGWLTENWNWRWVFYINIPVGVLCVLGILAFVPETPIDKSRKLDGLGFGMLSLAIGALQMMLDRGESQDWFGSTEVIIECVLAVAGLYYFIAHSITAEKPFISPGVFKDRNLVAAVTVMFIAGAIMYAPMTLLPPYLQSLKGFPVVTTGLVMAPRGVGTLTTMILVGRLIGKIDSRVLIFTGVSMVLVSMWLMTVWNLDVTINDIIVSGVLQGMGLGLVFPPLAAIAFVTLPTTLRTEGAAMFSLMRNIGSSIGISVVEALLTSSIQVNHSTLAENITPYNQALRAMAGPTGHLSAQTMAMVDAEVTRQAASIGYLNDFRMVMWMTVAVFPFIFLLRTKKKDAPAAEPPGEPIHAAME
ncbi:MAG TPA: DHA2 family efflux MFS transporter permease subunit [Magnetospirillaceae bacterium]|jgi:DHA2 family multidrug resistance protein